MAVTEGPPDPWQPFMDAVDELVIHARSHSSWSPLVDLARSSFAASKRLRVDVRELFSRTAKLNDGVSALETVAKAHAGLTGRLEERLGQVEEVAANTAQGAADGEAVLHRQIDYARVAAKTWILSLSRRVDHAFERIDFNCRLIGQLTETGFLQQWRLDDLEKKHDRLQLLVDELAGIVDEPEELDVGPSDEGLDDAIAFVERWSGGCRCERCRSIQTIIDAARRTTA